MPAKSGLSKNPKDKFSINVVFFAPADAGISASEEAKFKELTSRFRGELKVLNGLEAIQSTVSGTE
jgi:hypothetical protein